ncbi:MAG: DUF4199 domain-containing protein [Ferruginibacter sp.]|nr:DUF4199 domain-containing protein [Bacteroidota bacterium]MBX2919941.1 DUF4199 domain-containing protein [Ferruginibacter sp.]MCB0710337.1 DUF4199 domain-containing protein [Chitinophagaceae bacterium]
MMKNINATNKGLLTGIIMIALSLIFYYTGQPFESPLQYVIYIVYAAGIVWTIFDYSKSGKNSNKFGDFFLQAFKCFIVVALLMVVFTFVFNKLHPEFRDEMAKAYGDELIKKGNSTPAEVQANIDKMKQYYLTMLISSAIFGYLLTGAAISAVASLFFIKKK